ncbi:Transcriptional regulator LysR family [Cupriavidus necator]|uniref:Transcriptional regulator LysR family n=2 Tax=Cupriavidus necator TaxID=106590 RepID=A0A1K0JR84_CUPNE|nr:Transcriptional regulator LysR family [Cupriavidus necator]
MTASLKGLEDVVGAPLFSRHAAGVKLTAAGIRFLRHAQQIEAAVRDAVSAAAVTPSAVTGAIRLGVTETITAYVLPKLLPALEQKFPLLKLEILERPRGDIEADIQAGKLDLALLLVSNLPEMHHIGCETLLRSPRQLWGHPDHPLMQLEQISLTDVARHDYILLDMDEHIATVIKYWGQYGLTPSVRLQSCSIEAVRSLVAAGRGVSILSDLVYRPWSLEGQRILRRSLSDRVPSMDVGLIWRLDPGPDEHTHALREFLRIALLETMR